MTAVTDAHQIVARSLLLAHVYLQALIERPHELLATASEEGPDPRADAVGSRVGKKLLRGVVLRVYREGHEVEVLAESARPVLDLSHPLRRFGADAWTSGEDRICHPDPSVQLLASERLVVLIDKLEGRNGGQGGGR